MRLLLRLSHILYLYRARLRARVVLVQEGFAILGIAVGVALLFSSQVGSAGLTRSVAQLDRQIVGDAQLQLEARGPDGFDERLLERTRRLPGVQEAFPILERQASVIGVHGGPRSVDLIGADPRYSDVARSLLPRQLSVQQLAAQQAIVLPTPLAQAIGSESLQTIKLQVGASVTETLLGATLGAADVGGALAHSSVAIAPIAYAQRLTGMHGRITRIFVRALPGRKAEVRAGLAKLATAANANLEPADYDSQLFAVAVGPESKSVTLFSAISALVGFMFALNAMLITVPARRRLIEEIRRQGATRSMVVQVLLFDAAALGALGCVIGLALGDLLSLAIFRSTPGYLAFAFPVGNDRVVTWPDVALALGAGLAAAAMGVLWPLRDVLARPTQTEGASGSRRRIWIGARPAAGIVCIALTTFILLADTQAAIIGMITLVGSLVCLLPSLFAGLVSLVSRAQRLLGGTASALAVVALQTPQTRVRSLAIAATAAVAVFGTVAFQGVQANLARGLDASSHEVDAIADVWVTPGGEANGLTTIPFADSPSRALADLPGVRAVGRYRGGLLDWGDRRLWVIAPSVGAPYSIPASRLLVGDSARATASVRGGGWAVLSQALASEHDLHVGQTFVLPAQRPTRLRVAALSTNLGWAPGVIVMNATDYARAWASSDPSAYEIQTLPGASAATVRSRVRRVLGSATGLVVETSRERERRQDALATQGLSRLTQIRLLVLIAAVLAVAGALGSMLWQRRDLVAFMKVDGYRRGVLWRWLVCESAILLVAGCSMGAMFGLYGQLLGSHYLSSVTGYPIVFDVEPLAALANFALVCLVAVAVAALPGYLVARVPARAVSPAY